MPAPCDTERRSSRMQRMSPMLMLDASSSIRAPVSDGSGRSIFATRFGSMSARAFMVFGSTSVGADVDEYVFRQRPFRRGAGEHVGRLPHRHAPRFADIPRLGAGAHELDCGTIFFRIFAVGADELTLGNEDAVEEIRQRHVLAARGSEQDHATLLVGEVTGERQ